MDKVLPDISPLGRLYDPLPALAARIHRALGARCKTVCADNLGGVFLVNIACARSLSPHSVVGTYDARTPWLAIEDDLRLALRERASLWITDWATQLPSNSRKEDRCKSTPRSRGRPLRTRAAIIGIALHPVAAP